MLEIRPAKNKAEKQAALEVRQHVFVEEQGVPAAMELDKHDSDGSATHFIALNEGKVVGTARIRVGRGGIKLERFAVEALFRAQGVGRGLVTQVLKYIMPKAGKTNIYLHAQEAVVPFYEKLQFEVVSDRFYEAGIPHFKMIYKGPRA